jgi:hypothetical protein
VQETTPKGYIRTKSEKKKRKVRWNFYNFAWIFFWIPWLRCWWMDVADSPLNILCWGRRWPTSLGPFVERPMCFGIKVGVVWSNGRITAGLRYLYISSRFTKSWRKKPLWVDLKEWKAERCYLLGGSSFNDSLRTPWLAKVFYFFADKGCRKKLCRIAVGLWLKGQSFEKGGKAQARPPQELGHFFPSTSTIMVDLLFMGEIKHFFGTSPSGVGPKKYCFEQ